MAGDALREMGVLLLVFGPLDYVFAETPVLTGWGVSAIVGVALASFVAGLVLERVRT